MAKTKINVDVVYSDDYASLTVGKTVFYYGYEEEDDNGDWCFTVSEKNKVVFRESTTWIKSRVNDNQLDTPRDFLLAGIGIYILLFKN